MLNCPGCGAGVQGMIVTFPDENTRKQIEGTLAEDLASAWQVVDETRIWFQARLFYDCLSYWMEFYPISSWKANWSDLSTEGRISVLEEVSFAELATCKPSLWVEDVIRSGRIRMMMQPIVNVTNGCTYGYEMLARGISEDKSVISPLDLYSSARQQSQLFRLDRTCRIAGIEAASQLSEETFIFINFVPTSIYVPEHCLTTTIAAVDRLGIDRGRIVFEVVETDKVRDMNHLKRILSFYRDQGFRYALDDFGEGFNDLEMLYDLNPDILKLDRKYVTDIDANPMKQAFAENTCQHAAELGVTLLAEGIERIEEAQLLADIGYHLQQGYWYGKPSWEPLALPSDQFQRER